MRREAPRLGLGGIAPAREWGVGPKTVHSSEITNNLYSSAYKSGVRIFDTAPSYASISPSGMVIRSEFRLGNFLTSLTAKQRAEITVITKFGEHFNPNHQPQYYSDHSLQSLRDSLRDSVNYLGSAPDILLIHKASADVVQSSDVQEALDFATSEFGIQKFGVSISDPQTAMETLSLHDARIKYIQIPFNTDKEAFRQIIELAHDNDITVITNRPFGEGKTTLAGNDLTNETTRREIRKQALTEAFRFAIDPLLETDIILTGAGTEEHLLENVKLYKQAARRAKRITQF